MREPGRGCFTGSRSRPANDDATERAVVADELRRIALLRLGGCSMGDNTATQISTHVLDTVTGDPARGVPVRLDRRDGDAWRTIAAGRTDSDGRLRPRIPTAEWQAGGYRLVFEVQPYFGREAFFPEITVAFHVADPGRHYHVPLLLSRYGYTTYRGS